VTAARNGGNADCPGGISYDGFAVASAAAARIAVRNSTHKT
jgi:hypothetical protein